MGSGGGKRFQYPVILRAYEAAAQKLLERMSKGNHNRNRRANQFNVTRATITVTFAVGNNCIQLQARLFQYLSLSFTNSVPVATKTINHSSTRAGKYLLDLKYYPTDVGVAAVLVTVMAASVALVSGAGLIMQSAAAVAFTMR